MGTACNPNKMRLSKLKKVCLTVCCMFVEVQIIEDDVCMSLERNCEEKMTLSIHLKHEKIPSIVLEQRQYNCISCICMYLGIL